MNSTTSVNKDFYLGRIVELDRHDERTHDV